MRRLLPFLIFLYFWTAAWNLKIFLAKQFLFTAEFFSKETFLFGRYSIFYATCKKFKFSHVFWWQVKSKQSWDEWAAEQVKNAWNLNMPFKPGMKNRISAETKCFFWNWFGCNQTFSYILWRLKYVSMSTRLLFQTQFSHPHGPN